MKRGTTPAAIIAALAGDFDNFLAASTPGGIEQQERGGQLSFVRNETLPRELNTGRDSRESLGRLGIEVTGNADDLFYSVKLPEGWHKVAEDHAMWSRLVDDKGRERAAIFYKAAFYDRKAHISVTSRFSTSDEPVGGYDNYDWDNPPPRISVVKDQGKIIWQSEPVNIPKGGYEISKALREQGCSWLNEHYPEWADEFAYWD